MNWGKGFFRMWVVSSIVWAVYAGLDIWKDVERSLKLSKEYNVPHTPLSERDYIFIALYIVLPPLAIYIGAYHRLGRKGLPLIGSAPLCLTVTLLQKGHQLRKTGRKTPIWSKP